MIQQPSSDHQKFSSITAQFYENIFDSYQNYNLRNAIFLAERLKYLKDTENNTCLLAECYLADNSPYKAYSVLKPLKGKRARYLYAVACFRINKLQEAEETLLSSDAPNPKSSFKQSIESVLNGAHGMYLLAQVSEKLQKKQQAADCYLKAFQKNPTLFIAFEKYIQLRSSNDNPDQLLAYFKSPALSALSGDTEILNFVFKSYLGSCAIEKENFSSEAERITKRLSGTEIPNNYIHSSSKNSSAKFIFKNLKPTSNEEQCSHLTSSLKKASPAKSKKKMQAELVPNIHKVTTNHSITGSAHKNNQTVFSSLFNNPPGGSPIAFAPSQTHGPPNFSSGSKNSNLQSQLAIEGPVSAQDFQISLLDYLNYLAIPYIKFLTHDPLEALTAFKQLIKPLDQDPWVLINMARSYTELSLHCDAEKFFKSAFMKEPHRTESIDYYSSCLWHLKKQTELSQLAYNCLEKHYFASETWTAMANCFSLNKDHDTSISYLNRSIQLDPLNSYAHCLLGHEYFNKENFEKAREYYQKAINLDSRNVRAYFGLGNLCLQTDRVDMAIDYFLTAIGINDRSSTFYTQLGVAFMKKKDYHQAMNYFRKGEAICPTDKCNKYNKCQALYQLGNYEEALQECECLLKEVKEASIYTLMGQIQQKLNMVEQAHNNYITACNMDRKEGSKLKKLIESLHRSDI